MPRTGVLTGKQQRVSTQECGIVTWHWVILLAGNTSRRWKERRGTGGKEAHLETVVILQRRKSEMVRSEVAAVTKRPTEKSFISLSPNSPCWWCRAEITS